MRPVLTIRRPSSLVASLVALAVLVGAMLATEPGAVLALLPALLLFAVLLSGAAPGEDLLERLRERRRPRRRRARPVRPLPYCCDFVRPVGRLIAAALAVRPPPLALVS